MDDDLVGVGHDRQIRFYHSSNGGMFGEPDALLSMTALWAAAEGGREAIIDESDPLAMLAANRMNGGL